VSGRDGVAQAAGGGTASVTASIGEAASLGPADPTAADPTAADPTAADPTAADADPTAADAAAGRF
jgi:hypothetical protein